jgi:polyketide synthase 13
VLPGSHVATPDGRHVWEYAPRGATDLAGLVKAAASQVFSDAAVTAAEQRAVPGDGARLVTTLTRHPGGASVQVHARIDESFTLVYDAIVTRGGQAVALPAAVATGTVGVQTDSLTPADPAADGAGSDVAAGAAPAILSDNLAQGANLGAGLGKWSPNSGEAVRDRLGLIVGSAMGYEPEDLPWEVPLIELGLDSLMAVRIKNRVEYDFDLPPIQLTAVRDANLYAVEQLIIYAIEHREEVDQLAEAQKGKSAEEIAAEQAELMGGASTVAELEEKLAAAGHPLGAEQAAEQAAVLSGANLTTATTPVPDPQAEPSTQDDSPADAIPAPPTDPAGPDTAKSSAAKAAAQVLTQEAVTEALGADVPPRDAAERVTFATWAIVTGKSPGGIFNELPKVDAATAAKMAERLTERAEGTITADDVTAAKTIEELATAVREHLEAGKVDGFVRVLRAPQEGSTRIPVFVFHPAGGSTVVYEPLLNRLPADTPMYGIERVEGSVEERAAEYVPKLLEMHKGPFILAGWSLGGVLAYACAIGLKQAGADVRFVGLIDAVRAGEEVPQTKEETRARWERYARFAERTFNVQIPEIPYDELENLDDAGQVTFVMEAVAASGVQIPGGIIEHQRTSYLDKRMIDTAEIKPYEGHVTLYMADRYHDDAIYFEPRYATRQPDGGWGEYVSELEVVPIGGEHIQAIDEPYIAKVGAHMSEAINRIEAQGK